jgi:hypothetical protein
VGRWIAQSPSFANLSPPWGRVHTESSLSTTYKTPPSCLVPSLLSSIGNPHVSLCPKSKPEAIGVLLFLWNSKNNACTLACLSAPLRHFSILKTRISGDYVGDSKEFLCGFICSSFLWSSKATPEPKMLNRCLRTCLEQQKQYRGLRRGARTKNKDLGRYVFLYFES